jgi:hypothetical protein
VRVFTTGGDFERIPLTIADKANRKDSTDGSSGAGALLPFCIDCDRSLLAAAIVPSSGRVTGRQSQTLVITQSSLGLTLAVSWQRFIGTALGAAIGGLVATYFRPDMLVFVLGLFCAALRAERSAYRLGGVTFYSQAWFDFRHKCNRWVVAVSSRGYLAGPRSGLGRNLAGWLLSSDWPKSLSESQLHWCSCTGAVALVQLHW